MRLDFTEAQLRDMQRIGLQNIQNHIHEGKVPTLDQIRSSLQKNHGVVKWGDHEADFGGLATDVGMAKTPADILAALYSHGWATPNRIIEDLATMSVGVQRDWPMSLKWPKCAG